MYPLGRLFSSFIRATMSGPIGVDAVCETTFRCMPWDIDLWGEMNNGRVLTLYDVGRINLAIRTGLARVLKRENWGLVVAGSSVRYRRRVRMFDKVTMRSQVSLFEERWIYVVQSMWVNGQPTSSVLVRTAVTKNGKAIVTDRVLEALNVADWKPEPSDWIESWKSSEEMRPWPPSP